MSIFDDAQSLKWAFFEEQTSEWAFLKKNEPQNGYQGKEEEKAQNAFSWKRTKLKMDIFGKRQYALWIGFVHFQKFIF